MGSYLKIHHTPNENGDPQYTVIRDDGDPKELEMRMPLNDPMLVIMMVADYLADCEGK